MNRGKGLMTLAEVDQGLCVGMEKDEQELTHRGFKSLSTSLVVLLKVCAQKKDLHKGVRLHADILDRDLLGKNLFVASALVSMYGKCGALSKAQKVLDELPVRDPVTYNALIVAYAQQGHGKEAVSCFERMQCEGLSPNAFTFSCILKACGSIGAADKGKQVHDEIVNQGLLRNNIVLGNALVDMYSKCGALTNAQQVFDELPIRDIVSWNALIAGYAQQGHGKEALNCFRRMQCEGLVPDVVTFICILKACGSLGAIDKGRQIHDEIVSQGLLGKDIVLGNALVDMYAKCGALAKAQQVLNDLPVRDVVSWSALLAGYAKQGQQEEALNCFERMQGEGLSPNAGTFICLLKACGSIREASKGKQLHDEIINRGLLGKSTVLGNALVDMYVKCGVLANAQQVLEELPIRDVVTWSSLIAGYAQQGEGEEALNCFARMQYEGLSPNSITLICILKACGSIGAADKGKQIHDKIVSQGWLGKDIVLGTALIDMYARCGVLNKAQQVLDELPARDVVSWNALVAGYAQQGQGDVALICFERMQSEGLSPNAVTFTSVLSACSRSGLVDEGQLHLASMSKNYGITPGIEHHTCIVDLFGRAGHFDKAIAVIKEMPFSDDLPVWCALLGACLKWGNVKLGRWAFQHAVRLDKNGPEAYVCMANIYAAAGMEEDAEKIEVMRLEMLHGRIDSSKNDHNFSARRMCSRLT